MSSSIRIPRSQAVAGWAIFWLVLVVAVTAAGTQWLGADQRQLLAGLRNAPRFAVIVALWLSINTLLQALFAHVLVVSLGGKIRWRHSIALVYVATMLNFVLPMRAGMAFRAVFLKRLYTFPLTLFASSMVAMQFATLMAAAFFGLVGLVWVSTRSSGVPPQLLWPLVAVIVLCALAFALTRTLRVRLRSRLHLAFEGWQKICRDPKTLIAAALSQVGTFVVGTAGLYYSFNALGLGIDLPGSLLLLTSLQLGGLASITPGAIGFQEAVGIYVSTALDLSLPECLTALAAMRFVSIAVSVTTGLPCLEILRRRMAEAGETDDSP